MSKEIRKYDDRAIYIYELHKEDHWAHFYHLPRKERDYWRALAQVSIEEYGDWEYDKGKK